MQFGQQPFKTLMTALVFGTFISDNISGHNNFNIAM